MDDRWVIELAYRPGAESKRRRPMWALACFREGDGGRRGVEIDCDVYDLLMERVRPDGGRDWQNDLVAYSGRKIAFLAGDLHEGERQWEYVRVLV